VTAHRFPRRIILGIAGVALLSALLMAWVTGHGVGASRDSCSYFHFARVLLGQELVQEPDGGPQVALTHFPPLYPAMLALAGVVKMNLLHAARWINVLSYGAGAGLFAAIVWRLRGSAVRTAIGALLLILQPAYFGCQLWAASEPPFFVFELAAVWLLAEFLLSDSPKAWRFAAAAGLALAVANFTRYVGGFLFPAACITVLLAARPWRERRIALAWLIGSFAVPVLLLAVGQRLLLDSVTHRSIEYHPLTATHWWNLLTTLQGWLASRDAFGRPAVWLAWISLAAILLPLPLREGAGGGVRGDSSRSSSGEGSEKALADESASTLRRPSGPLPLTPPARGGGKIVARIAGPAVLIYIALLMFSVAFVDNATPVDDRLLAPAALMLLLWAVVAIRSPFSFTGWRRGVIAAATGLALLIVAGSGVLRAAHQTRDLRKAGFGFNHVNFRNSPLVKLSKKIPQSTPMYSNYPEAIFLHAGHLCAILPGHPTALGRETDDPMEAAFGRMENTLRNGGYVAYFGFRSGKSVAAIPASIDELKARIPLVIEKHTKDGTLLRALPTSQPATPATTQGATTTAVP